MALQTSGAISLLNIQNEFGGSNPIAISEYYGAASGIPTSGLISISNFYGASAVQLPTIALNAGGILGYAPQKTVTRLNVNGTLIGTETVATNNMSDNGAAGLNQIAVCLFVNKVERIGSNGTTLSSSTIASDFIDGRAGAKTSTVGVYYGGSTYSNKTFTYFNNVVRLTEAGVVYGSQTYIGTKRRALGGAGTDSNISIFHGGVTTNNTYTNILTRISDSGTIIGSESNIGTALSYGSGAKNGNTGIFYGGANGSNSINIAKIINTSGTLQVSETSIGTARTAIGASDVGGISIFFGGSIGIQQYNRVTRLSSTATIIGSETSVGTARSNIGATGI